MQSVDNSPMGSTQGDPHPATPIRVLLAEDDADVRTSLAQLFHLSGYQVHVAASGSQLLDTLSPWILGEIAEPPFDLIVTDVRMPGFSGLNIVEGLRQNGLAIPVVIITAFGDEAMQERIDGMGDVVLFRKPFVPEDLERTIIALVRGSRGLS